MIFEPRRPRRGSFRLDRSSQRTLGAVARRAGASREISAAAELRARASSAAPPAVPRLFGARHLSPGTAPDGPGFSPMARGAVPRRSARRPGRSGAVAAGDRAPDVSSEAAARVLGARRKTRGRVPEGGAIHPIGLGAVPEVGRLSPFAFAADGVGARRRAISCEAGARVLGDRHKSRGTVPEEGSIHPIEFSTGSRAPPHPPAGSTCACSCALACSSSLARNLRQRSMPIAR